MRTIFLHLFLVLSLVGCAAFPGKQISKAGPFPAVSKKSSIGISLAFKQVLNGQKSTVMAQVAEARMQKIVLERFSKSGLYSSVTPSTGNADIELEIELTDEGEANLTMAFITGLTLYVVPSSAKDTFKLSAKAKFIKGHSGKSFELKDSVTMHQQIVLVPIMPFRLLPVVTNGVINNLFDTLALQVYQSSK